MNTLRVYHPPLQATPRRQRGVTLFIALIALVALSLAGIGFMRSVDTQTLLAGNLAFNRASVAISDVGMETARAQIASIQSGDTAAFCTGVPAVTNCLWKDGATFAVPQTGYSAWSEPDFDYRNANWANAYTVVNGSLAAAQATAVQGYTIQYFVHRMCERRWVNGSADPNLSGDPQRSNCLTSATLGGQCQGAVCPGGTNTATLPPVYRTTIRVTGPRNSLAYVQVWMN